MRLASALVLALLACTTASPPQSTSATAPSPEPAAVAPTATPAPVARSGAPGPPAMQNPNQESNDQIANAVLAKVGKVFPALRSQVL